LGHAANIATDRVSAADVIASIGSTIEATVGAIGTGQRRHALTSPAIEHTRIAHAAATGRGARRRITDRHDRAVTRRAVTRRAVASAANDVAPHEAAVIAHTIRLDTARIVGRRKADPTARGEKRYAERQPHMRTMTWFYALVRATSHSSRAPMPASASLTSRGPHDAPAILIAQSPHIEVTPRSHNTLT
jgi:hypothetical protein